MDDVEDVEELLPARFASVQPEWADELDEAIVAGAELPAVVADFEIPDDGWADWAMRKLATLDRRRQTVADQANVWRAPIDDWEAAEKRRVEGGIEFFAGLLERYALRWRAEHPKEATLRLPSGSVPTTAPKKPTVVVVDEDAVVAWAADTLTGDTYDQVVNTKTSIRLVEFRKVVAAEAREVPFCVVCGAALGRFDDSLGGGWSHTDEDGDDFNPDVDHHARPVVEYDVLFAGDVVPGAVAEMGPTTAHVKPIT